MKSNHLYYLSGLPALGKSTYTREIQQRYAHKHLLHVMSADDEIEAIARERGVTYDSIFDEVREEARDTAYLKLLYAIDEGIDIVWDQVNINSYHRTKSLKDIPDHYMKIGIVLLPPKNDEQYDEWYERLHSRPGKTIPYDVLMTMADHFTLPTITDGLDSCHYYDPFEDREVTDIQQIFDAIQYTKSVASDHFKLKEIIDGCN